MRWGNSFRSAAAFSVASNMDLYCLTWDTMPEILEDKSEEEQRVDIFYFLKRRKEILEIYVIAGTPSKYHTFNAFNFFQIESPKDII
jgi:hypothetical protein